MDALVILVTPLILMWMLLRLMIPRGVLEVTLGHRLRDFFWIAIRSIGTMLALPFLILSFVLRDTSEARSPRRRRRSGRRQRRY